MCFIHRWVLLLSMSKAGDMLANGRTLKTQHSASRHKQAYTACEATSSKHLKKLSTEVTIDQHRGVTVLSTALPPTMTVP